MNGTNDAGWVKLHRKLLDSPVWEDHNLTHFWVWVLLRASYQKTVVKNGRCSIELLPGQLLYSHAEASIHTGLSQRAVRTCVETLDKQIAIQIDRQMGRQKSILTVLNWDSYQGDIAGKGRKKGRQNDKQMGSLYYKEDKKLKNIDQKIEAVDVVWDGEKLDVPDVLMTKYQAKYPRLDIAFIIIDAERWLLKNPAKAAGYKSLDAFLNNWLRREDEKRRERDPDADYELRACC